MTPAACSALRRRCTINRIMMRTDLPYSSRLARALSLFPTHTKIWS